MELDEGVSLNEEEMLTFQRLSSALKDSLAEAEALRAESQRLSALKETLTAQLQSSTEAMASYRNEEVLNGKIEDDKGVTEVSGFNKEDDIDNDNEEEDEENVNTPGLGAELLPFIEREMRGIAEQVAKLQRGELPEGFDPSDPSAEATIVSALEKRLEMLTRLDRLVQIERAISSTDGTSFDIDEIDRADAITAVASLPDHVGNTVSNKIDNDNINDEETADFLSKQAMLAEKEREVAELEAQVAALSAHRDELNRMIVSTSTSVNGAARSTHHETPIVSQSRSDKTESFMSTTLPSKVVEKTIENDSCDFSTLDEDSQAIVVQARMQLLSSVLESDTFDGIVKTSVRTMSAPTAESEYQESLSVNSLRAGAPAFMTTRSVLAVIRSSIRISAAKVLQETTHEIKSIDDIITHSLFVSTFRREVVRLLLSGIPIAIQLHNEEETSLINSSENTQQNSLTSIAAEARQQSADAAASLNKTSSLVSSSPSKVVSAIPAAPPKPAPLSSVVSSTQLNALGENNRVRPPAIPKSSSTRHPLSQSHSKNKSNTLPLQKQTAEKSSIIINSRINRLAQPNQRYVRSKIVLPSEVKATEDFMATANFYGVKKDGSKLPFRVWPKAQVKSKLAPAREKPSPSKEADERHRIAAQVLGRTSTSSNTLRNEENFSYADLAMSYAATESENIYGSQQRQTQTQFEPSNQNRPIIPVLATSLEILAAGTPSGPPSPRARPGWEIPSYTGASALPQSRVFDATSSSYRVLTERKLYLQRVFPDVEAHYASLRDSVAASQVPLAQFPAPFGGQDSGKPISLEATSRSARTRSSSPTHHQAIAASSNFIYRPRSSTGGSHSTTLSEQGVASFDAAAILPQKGDRRSRSSSLTKSEAFGTTLAPRRQGQDGCRHTYIHNVWHKSYTTVSSIKQWARVAGNTTTGQEPFKILHLVRPPPPPSSYWYSSARAPGAVSSDRPTNIQFGSVASELYNVSNGGGLQTSRVENEPYLGGETFRSTSKVALTDFSSSQNSSHASEIAKNQVEARWGTWDMPPEVEAVLNGSQLPHVAMLESQQQPKSIEKPRVALSAQSSSTTTSSTRSFSFTPSSSSSSSSLSTFSVPQTHASVSASVNVPAHVSARKSSDSSNTTSLSTEMALKPQLDIYEGDVEEEADSYVIAAITSARSTISRHSSSKSVTGLMTSPTVYDDDDELGDTSGWRKRQFGSSTNELRPTLNIDEGEAGTQIMNEADVYHDAHVQASITSAREKIASFRIDPKPEQSPNVSKTTKQEKGVTVDRPSTSRKVPRPSADEFMSYVRSPSVSVKTAVTSQVSNVGDEQWNIVKEDAKLSDAIDEVTKSSLSSRDLSLNSSFTATMIDADKVIEEQKILVSNLKDILSTASITQRSETTEDGDQYDYNVEEEEKDVLPQKQPLQDERLRRHYERLLQIGRSKPLR